LTTDIAVDSPAAKPTAAAGTLWPWYSAEMLASYASTLVPQGIYWYAKKVLHTTDSQQLWLAASFGYAYIFIAFFAGRLADRWGPRRTAITTVAGCVVAALLGLVCTWKFALIGVAIALLLYNITSTTFWPAAETAVTRVPGKGSLATRTSFYNIVWAVTCFLAYFTVGWIFQHGHFTAFVIAAGLSAIGLTILTIYTRPNSVPRGHGHDLAAQAEEDPAVAKRARRLLHMAWIGNALAYVAIQTLAPMIPTLALRAHIATPANGAAIASVWTLTRTLFFVLVLGWTSWHYSVRYLLGFQALLVVSFFTTMQLDNLRLPPTAVIPVFMLSQVAFGVATGFVYTSSLYYAMHVSRGGGGHAGLHEALIGIGIAIGPTIGAIAGTGQGEQTVARVAYSVTAMLALGTLLMLLMGLKAPKIAAKS